MSKQETIRTMLAMGRHRLDVGRAMEVAELVLAKPRKVGQLIECLWDEDPGLPISPPMFWYAPRLNVHGWLRRGRNH